MAPSTPANKSIYASLWLHFQGPVLTARQSSMLVIERPTRANLGVGLCSPSVCDFMPQGAFLQQQHIRIQRGTHHADYDLFNGELS